MTPASTHIAVPPHIDAFGRTATASEDDYLRDLIREVLFTAPGERVNRPDFGCGLRQLVLAPADETLAATTQLTVHSALTRWLGEEIEVDAVEVTSEGETLRVLVGYTVRGSDRRAVEEFGWSL